MILASCATTDLAFVNEVKTFDPRWMDLSEKFRYVKRNLELTEVRYQKDLDQISELFKASGKSSRFSGMKSTYNEMVDERDKILEDFDSQMAEFEKTVYEFNEWENKLMRNDLDPEQAKQDFFEFKNTHGVLLGEIDELQTRLIKNIESHNSVIRRMTQALGIHTSYELDPK